MRVEINGTTVSCDSQGWPHWVRVYDSSGTSMTLSGEEAVLIGQALIEAGKQATALTKYRGKFYPEGGPA